MRYFSILEIFKPSKITNGKNVQMYICLSLYMYLCENLHLYKIEFVINDFMKIFVIYMMHSYQFTFIQMWNSSNAYNLRCTFVQMYIKTNVHLDKCILRQMYIKTNVY